MTVDTGHVVDAGKQAPFVLLGDCAARAANTFWLGADALRMHTARVFTLHKTTDQCTTPNKQQQRTSLSLPLRSVGNSSAPLSLMTMM
jgi:purine nucleoside permease